MFDAVRRLFRALFIQPKRPPTEDFLGAIDQVRQRLRKQLRDYEAYLAVEGSEKHCNNQVCEIAIENDIQIHSPSRINHTNVCKVPTTNSFVSVMWKNFLVWFISSSWIEHHTR